MGPRASRLSALLAVMAGLAAYTLGPWLPGDWLSEHESLWWIWVCTLPVLWFVCVFIGFHLWGPEETAAWGFGLVWGSILFYVPFWFWTIFILLPDALADG